MSRNGHEAASAPVDADDLVVRSLALRLRDGQTLEPHQHPWGQLEYATEGVMTVSSGNLSWVVPPLRAVWVPANTSHGVHSTGRVHMRTVYVHPRLCRTLPTTCAVLSVTPLLREIVLEIVSSGMLSRRVPEQLRLARVLVDRIRASPVAALTITWPSDPRARRVADRVAKDLAATSDVARLARGSGASARTIQRLFLRETGLTFERWRTRLRVLGALRLLAAGESVTATALAVGFQGTSAFVAMFRRTLGVTPGRYFASIEG